jgi:lysophospholipase L1-like esterase
MVRVGQFKFTVWIASGILICGTIALGQSNGTSAASRPTTQPRPITLPGPVLNPLMPDLPPPPTTIAIPHVNTANIPYPQYYDDELKVSRGNIATFNRLHTANVTRAKQGGIDVLFIGDSITQFWTSRQSRTVWNANFTDKKFADFGVSADRTQNVLWRLQHGEGEGYTPKVVVLMIGTNNLGQEVSFTRYRNTAPEIADGIHAIINEFQTRFPDVKILLFGIFPRGQLDSESKEPMRKYAGDVNDIISKFDDGKRVFYVDIGPQFLGPDGHILPGIMSDAALIHPAQRGYEIWAKAIMDRLPGLGVSVAAPATKPAQ